MEYNIEITDDYDTLKYFYYENDLEIDVEEPMPQEVVRNWKAVDNEGKLLGGITLSTREGEFIIDGIAVDSEYRMLDIGRKLLDTAIEEMSDRGGKRLYLVARAPSFFRKCGFETVEKKVAPEFFECFGCPQYGERCFPEVMKLEI